MLQPLTPAEQARLHVPDRAHYQDWLAEWIGDAGEFDLDNPDFQDELRQWHAALAVIDAQLALREAVEVLP